MEIQDLKNKSFFQVIKFMFFLIFLIISFLMLAISPLLDYMCKKNFALSNVKLLILDIVMFSTVLILWRTLGKRYSDFIDRYATAFILVCSVILFLGQVYLCYNIYFISGWDAGYVFQTAQLIAAKAPLNADFHAYYSRYPNNITLTWIYSVIIRLSAKLGISNLGNGLGAIIVINCFVSSFSSILTFKSVEKLTNKKWAVLSWVIYLLLIGTASWILITYSDPFALFLPILIFFIYTRNLTGKYNLLKWFTIGIVSFWGYHIKPQVMIVLIAILIVEIWTFIFSTNTEKKQKCAILGILIVAFFFSSVSCKIITRQTGLSINKEEAFRLTHFAMMGLSVETDGAYNGDDIAYSASFATSSERKSANINVIKKRLENLGIVNYAKFLSKKILVNYGDGTFAWGAEGNFYAELYPDKNSWVSPMLKSFFYSGRKNYNKTSTLEQALWVGVIMSALGIIFIKRPWLDKEVTVLMLSILGLTVFELLFEARARYLYIYTPIYISISVVSLRSVIFKLTEFKTHFYLNRKEENI